MFRYYNANPLGRIVNDCTVRAISTATDRSWNDVYIELSNYARYEGNMPDDVEYIDKYLKERFYEICDCQGREITVGDFVKQNKKGIYLITMKGHITCCIDGCIYDTFDPSDKYIWSIFKVN